MEKTVKFLNDAKVFFVSTINGDKPEVRPFGALNVYNGRLYITTSNTKDVYKQIMMNNNVAISAVLDGEWIRISAKLVNDDSLDAKKSMLDANPNLRAMYNENDGKFSVLYLTEATATISSFTSAPIVEKF
jgi:uncharacterized pyridoxamine 5'-phosphate oxidase family protein